MAAAAAVEEVVEQHEEEQEVSSSSSSGRSGRRGFDSRQRRACWNRAPVVPGRHPDRWRYDATGSIVCSRLANCMGCLCYEYDHIIPYSKGGPNTVENCQLLQTRVNRSKSNQEELTQEDLQAYSCALKFSDVELDLVEMAVFGNVERPGLVCKCKSWLDFANSNVRNNNHNNHNNHRKKQQQQELPNCESPFGNFSSAGLRTGS
eukprot:jgi/Chlat1/4602/Chrsp290S04337